ncbi:MAG TPA: helix-hairpin-helix domain-containing protein [Chitinophagales bacterium]|nr:helix-hairpin-helix domain-containing protein [Chitinophagales bacterium]
MLKWLRQYFTFTAGEQKGIIVLIVVCLLAFIAPRAYLYFKPVQPVSNKAIQQQVDAFIAAYEKQPAERDSTESGLVQRSDSNHKTGNSDAVYVLDINTADAAGFEKLNGIGPVLATRIIKFRTVLGGFASVAQLHEVYGLPDSTYKRISHQLTVKAGEVQQLNINTGSYKDFKAHPYLRPFAKDIESYRNKNGSYKQTTDLKNITGITDSIYRKVAPYITVE